MKIGILTISDRASRGEYEDKGGPAIREFLTEALSCDWQPHALVIPDEQDHIEVALKALCDATDEYTRCDFLSIIDPDGNTREISDVSWPGPATGGEAPAGPEPAPASPPAQ